MGKVCIKCGVDKPLEDFPLRKMAKDGRRGGCSACVNSRMAEWRVANRVKIRVYHETWRDKDPEKYAAITRAANRRKRERDPEGVREYMRKNYHANKERWAEYTRRWRAKRPNYTSEYGERNRERLAKKSREYARANPGKAVARARKHQLLKARAMPAWLSPSQLADIQAIYDRAATMTHETGIAHNVDHIVPLNNKSVCGLHVPWNLQVMTAKENQSKNNKFAAG